MPTLTDASLVNWPACQPVNRSTDQLVNYLRLILANRSTDQPINYLAISASSNSGLHSFALGSQTPKPDWYSQ